MKRLLLPLLAALALPTAVYAFPFRNENCKDYKYSPSQLFKNKINSVVVVRTSRSQGSGFVVKQDKNNTYILTNAHVLDNKKVINIKWSDGQESLGKVVGNLGGYELSKDLALIKVPEKKGNPLQLIDKKPEIGIDAVVIGSPSGLEFSLTRGVVSQVRKEGDFVQIDAPVNPGNSGGPVFNYAGCVIGVVTFKKESSEGLNFAIGSKLISKFIKNPFIDKEAINKKIQSSYPAPPLPSEGPFPPFSRGPYSMSEWEQKLFGSPPPVRSIENEKQWETITIIKFDEKPLKNPETQLKRFMIRKKSIELFDNWYSFDVIEYGSFDGFQMFYTRGRGGYKDGSLMVRFGALRTMKVNCEERIVSEPKDYKSKFGTFYQKDKDKNRKAKNFYLTSSGWFLSQAEIDEAYIFPVGLMREHKQKWHSALFNYLCAQ